MRIQPIAIATLLQVALPASTTGPLESGGRPIEEDAFAAPTSVGRKRSQLHHKSHQRRHQKSDPYMDLAAHRELAGHDALDNDQQHHHSMSYSMSISMSTPPAMMCEFCPDGLTVEPETVLPTDDCATCAAAMPFAATLLAGHALCETVQLAQLFCCPLPASSIPLSETTSTTTEATTASTTTTTEEPAATSTTTSTEEEPSQSAKADTKSARIDAKAEKMTSVAKTHKTTKNPMAKAAKTSDHDEEETHDGVHSKSGKARTSLKSTNNAKTDSSTSGIELRTYMGGTRYRVGVPINDAANTTLMVPYQYTFYLMELGTLVSVALMLLCRASSLFSRD